MDIEAEKCHSIDHYAYLSSLKAQKTDNDYGDFDKLQASIKQNNRYYRPLSCKINKIMYNAIQSCFNSSLWFLI